MTPTEELQFWREMARAAERSRKCDELFELIELTIFECARQITRLEREIGSEK